MENSLFMQSISEGNHKTDIYLHQQLPFHPTDHEH